MILSSSNEQSLKSKMSLKTKSLGIIKIFLYVYHNIRPRSDKNDLHIYILQQF